MPQNYAPEFKLQEILDLQYPAHQSEAEVLEILNEQLVYGG
jgi:hypothetical protein